MLLARIITAGILAPLMIAAIYLLPPQGYAAVFFLIAALGAYEWAGLCNLTTVFGRLAFVGALALLVVVTWRSRELMMPALWLAVLVWLGAIATVLGYPRSGRLIGRQGIATVVGLVILWGAWVALVVIREVNPHWVVWLFFLAWGADVGAYFAGRWLGQRKLAPQVSPGKTWAGCWGGLAASLGLCTALQWWLLDTWTWQWLAVIAVLVMISVFGDLFESAMKRVRGAKDSGSLLPGHGGVLDRIDSLIAVLPFFAIFLTGLSS